MKPEQLKVIAEGMGYENIQILRGIVRLNTWTVSRTILDEYKPHTTNNNQMVEIMGKLKLSVYYYADVNTWYGRLNGDPSYGKTINEAVCNAAYEYFK